MRPFLLLPGVACAAGLAWASGCASSGPSASSLAGPTSSSTGGSGVSSSSTGGAGGGSGSSSSSASSASSASSSASSGASSSGSGGAGGSGPPPGMPLGAICAMDSDCASMLCKPVVIGVSPVCVTPCAQEADCAMSPAYFCEPITAGSAAGYCIPHSPAHCLSCTQDSDCGSLSEVCFQAPGDIAEACHVDCSIGGAAACPSDYTCTAEMVNGQARQLCRPTGVPDCLDALGGFCDRLALPQTCARTNATGNCLGQRTCLPSKRFDTCDAQAPQCKADCSLQDPAGCMESFCSAATSTVTNCGACGNVCPGYMLPADNVTCQNGTTCAFSCQGEHYDLDNDPTDGCEVADPTTGNHTKLTALATVPASVSCHDASDTLTISGEHIISDKRAHASPAVSGFDTVSGSAPDWFQTMMTGGFACNNTVVVTFTVSGSAFPTCYRIDLHFTGNGSPPNHDYGCAAGANGSCTIPLSAGGTYNGGDTLYTVISKTCDTTKVENVTYSVVGMF